MSQHESSPVKASNSLFKNRNFMLLWSGQLASWVGTEVSGVVLPLIVLALTHSPAQAGGVAAVRGIVYVIAALPAGALIDRLDRRHVMVVANAGSGIAVSLICLGLALDRLTLGELYLASAVEGACFVFANLARFAALRRVVPPEQYAAARVQTSMADNAALLSGPALGGFLFQVMGASFALLVDAASYFINAVSIFFIKKPLQDSNFKASTSIKQEIVSAGRWLLNQRSLRHLNLFMGGQTAIASGVYLLVVVVAHEGGLSSTAIGAIFAVGAVGGFVGAGLAGRAHKRFTRRSILIVTSVATCLAVGSYELADGAIALGLVTAVLYMLGPSREIASATYSVSVVPDVMQGRVSSITRIVELASHSLGFLLVGLLLEHVGSGRTIAAMCIASIGLAAVAMTDRAFRSI